MRDLMNGEISGHSDIENHFSYLKFLNFFKIQYFGKCNNSEILSFSLSGSIWTAFTDLGLGPDLVGTGVCLF